MTTTVAVLTYTIDGQPRERWFRQDDTQPKGSSATLAIDPPVTLTAEPVRMANETADRLRARGITNINVTTREI